MAALPLPTALPVPAISASVIIAIPAAAVNTTTPTASTAAVVHATAVVVAAAIATVTTAPSAAGRLRLERGQEEPDPQPRRPVHHDRLDRVGSDLAPQPHLGGRLARRIGPGRVRTDLATVTVELEAEEDRAPLHRPPLGVHRGNDQRIGKWAPGLGLLEIPGDEAELRRGAGAGEEEVAATAGQQNQCGETTEGGSSERSGAHGSVLMQTCLH